MSAHGVLALACLFDQVEILMDFSSPLTDEAVGFLHAGSFEPCGCRHKEPTPRSQVSDSGRVRKSGDCKPHPTPTPPKPPPPTRTPTSQRHSRTHQVDTYTHTNLHYYTCGDIWRDYINSLPQVRHQTLY